MGEYLVGNAVTLFEQFYDEDGAPADPTGIFFYVRDPAGDVTVYEYLVDAEVVRLTNPTTGATEGYYECRLGAPAMAGVWPWRVVGTGNVEAANEYEFTILASSTVTPLTDGPTFGPFVQWCDAQDIIYACPDAGGSDTQQLEQLAVAASQVLYELGGRQHVGLSQPVTVRPAADGCGCWPWNETWHSWGQVTVGWASWDAGLGRWGCNNAMIGCSPLSQVELDGYPVREVTQVKINGVVLDRLDGAGNENWRLDEWRFLVRMRDPVYPNVARYWPGCQDVDLPATSEGTFAVTYRFGQDPPEAGKLAAVALACELWKLSPEGEGECALPANATSMIRNQLSVDLQIFGAWRPMKGQGWNLPIPAVNLYLNTYNPVGLRRRPSVFSPWVTRSPRRVA